MQFSEKIDSIVREKSMLSHPFYQAWSSGRLSLQALREYAKQYYKLEAAFPTFLSAIHSRCDDRSARQALAENLADEELGPENHAELWLRFCEGLGLSRDEVLAAEALPETEKAITTFRKLARSGHFSSGVAAMYAYESQIPEVAKTKLEGLAKFYKIDDERSTKFFTVHEKADEWHSQAERDIMAKHAGDMRASGEMLESARAARDALWLFLDGVHRAYCA
jgi:pyrroloquinoline-quinone synthase